MSIYKRGSVYWYKFMWNGKTIRESTKQGNDKVARNMESAHRTALAKGEVGIREKKPAPTLREFLEKDFVPFVETKHAAKPATVEYYTTGAQMLSKSDAGALRIDEVSDQHGQQFAAQRSHLSASYINRALRTLRRSLNLAFEWGKLERPVKIHLASGERQRDRVLSAEESERYLSACPQPWRDCATIIVEEGMRPGEVFALKWSHVLMNGNGGLIQIIVGKSKAARRILPMTPRVYRALRDRHEAQGHPDDGWIFPSASRQGHVNHNTSKDQHARAFERLAADRKENPGLAEITHFEPYILRHTGLTRFAEAGADVYALAKIAGHSTILITQRYIHEGAEAIDRAFARLEEHRKALPPAESPIQVGTKMGTAKIGSPKK